MEKLIISIKGETINLCQPTKKFAGGDIWYKWLNDPFMNNHLDKKYRNHKNTKKNKLNFLLIIKKKKEEYLLFQQKITFIKEWSHFLT